MMTLPLRGNLIDRSREKDDEWGKTVLGHLEDFFRCFNLFIAVVVTILDGLEVMDITPIL